MQSLNSLDLYSDTRASFLAAPTVNPMPKRRSRSVSSSPSHRSARSHITTLEEKEDIRGTELKIAQVQRQHTYIIGRGINILDRIKGVFFPRTLFSRIENSIEVVRSDVPDDELFHRQESPWIVDVYVSPRTDSRNYHKTRCLLDTGCWHGNIVSREFADTLGFTPSDHQELSELESQGGVTMAGEPLPIEAAIFLSWHHNTSLKRFRDMRFLVSSQAKNFDMIIGAQTICKYQMLSQPVFNLTNGAVRIPGNEVSQNRLGDERATLQSQIEKIEDLIKDGNSSENVQLKAEQSELQHLLDLKEEHINLSQAKEQDKETFRAKIESLTKAWDTKYPKRTTETIVTQYENAQKEPVKIRKPNGGSPKSGLNKIKKSPVSTKAIRSRKH